MSRFFGPVARGWAIRILLQPMICYRLTLGAGWGHNLPDITTWSCPHQPTTNLCRFPPGSQHPQLLGHEKPALERGIWAGCQQHLLHVVLKEPSPVHVISFQTLIKPPVSKWHVIKQHSLKVQRQRISQHVLSTCSGLHAVTQSLFFSGNLQCR